VAVGSEAVRVLGLAQPALEGREQVRQRLLVVPHVGAGSRAAAGLVVAPLPRPELAAGQAQAGRALEDRAGRRQGLQHERRHGGRAQRLVVPAGLALEALEVGERVGGRTPRVGPERRHVRLPPGPFSLRARGRPVHLLHRPVPGDDDRQRARGARREAEPQPERRDVGPPRLGGLRADRLVETALRCLAPEIRQRVEPSAAHPAVEPGHAAMGGRERHGAGERRVGGMPCVLENDAPDPPVVPVLVDAAAGLGVAGQVREVGEERAVERPARRVRDGPLEYGAGDRGIPVVEWNERVPRGQRCGERERLV